ncbi:hypothetical protein PS862_01295 [Pseudomonas fluorescens]|uniref:Uncharacterized protein n=1 Tax=Pseudomonas fluorescens TaxID=294 RepID=A0A5E7I6J4_PSEFL|nr:hypothetical protein [Pseudomonas fluorescens]VVO70157.1 hypothetical protein PS862_01295 [Pseudomonas fluorescens]
MPLTEKELMERDAKRNIGEELLASILEVKAGSLANAAVGASSLLHRQPSAPTFSETYCRTEVMTVESVGVNGRPG